MPHEILVVEGSAGSGKTSLLLTLSGRMKLITGRAKIATLVLPEQAAAVRRQTAIVDCAVTDNLRAELRTVLAAKPTIIFVDHAERLTGQDDRAALASLLDEVAFSELDQAVVLACDDRGSVADLIATPYSYLNLSQVLDLADTGPTRSRGLA
jgi:RND superfamily putative drug exporter